MKTISRCLTTFFAAAAICLCLPAKALAVDIYNSNYSNYAVTAGGQTVYVDGNYIVNQHQSCRADGKVEQKYEGYRL